MAQQYKKVAMRAEQEIAKALAVREYRRRAVIYLVYICSYLPTWTTQRRTSFAGFTLGYNIFSNCALP